MTEDQELFDRWRKIAVIAAARFSARYPEAKFTYGQPHPGARASSRIDAITWRWSVGDICLTLAASDLAPDGRGVRERWCGPYIGGHTHHCNRPDRQLPWRGRTFWQELAGRPVSEAVDQVVQALANLLTEARSRLQAPDPVEAA